MWPHRKLPFCYIFELPTYRQIWLYQNLIIDGFYYSLNYELKLADMNKDNNIIINPHKSYAKLVIPTTKVRTKNYERSSFQGVVRL
jgi:hypothetical protein